MSLKYWTDAKIHFTLLHISFIILPRLHLLPPPNLPFHPHLTPAFLFSNSNPHFPPLTNLNFPLPPLGHILCCACLSFFFSFSISLYTCYSVRLQVNSEAHWSFKPQRRRPIHQSRPIEQSIWSNLLENGAIYLENVCLCHLHSSFLAVPF